MKSRNISILAIIGMLVVLTALSVVIPGEGSAIVSVARFGTQVRLLSDSPSVCFLPLARRIEVHRKAGAAVIEVPVDVPNQGGADVEASLTLALAGKGSLPIGARAIRERGWKEAWADWAQAALELTTDDTIAIIRNSAKWNEIFPESDIAGGIDVSNRLQNQFTDVTLEEAKFSLEASQAAVRGLAAQELGRLSKPPGRLIVLGLDALDWRLVDDLTGRGLMPNLKEILDRGAQAEVIVRPPLLSPLIWTSIATGVHPEVHGVLDFIERDPATGEPRPVGSASREVPALWEVAATAGRSASVIGWWATFPAMAPPGATVYSDRLTEQIFGFEDVTEGSVDPLEAADMAGRLKVRRADLTPEILAPIVEVSSEELAAVATGSVAWDEPIGGIQKLMAATLTIEKLTDHELERGTEIVLAYLEGTDTVGHLFAPHRPPPLPIVNVDEARRYGSVVDLYYAHVDRWIGRVVSQISERDTLAVVSDHGFRWFEDRPQVASGAHTATAEEWHRKEGVFIVAGPTVRPGGQRYRIGLLDMSASLFVLAGLPVGEGMPGVVPEWVIDNRQRVSVPVNYAALVPLENLAEAARTTTVSPEVTAEQMAKLRALGYIGDDEDKAGRGTGPEHDRFEARRMHNLGLRLTDSGDLEGAEDAYLRATTADPNYLPTHYAFAYLLRITGRYDEADEHFWQAVDLDPGDTAANIVRVAQHYRELGQGPRAESILREGSRRRPEAATIWLHLGALLGEKGDLEGARVCLLRAVELDPRDPYVYRNLAALQVAVGDFDGARRSLAAALTLEPGNQEVRRQLQSLGGPIDR